MEQQNKPFIHDTINLDEIRMLLGEDHDSSVVLEDEVVENSETVDLPVEIPEMEVNAADPVEEALLVDDEDNGIRQ